MNFDMHLMSKSLLFLTNQVWTEGRNVLLISHFMSAAICGSSQWLEKSLDFALTTKTLCW